MILLMIMGRMLNDNVLVDDLVVQRIYIYHLLMDWVDFYLDNKQIIIEFQQMMESILLKRMIDCLELSVFELYVE